MILAVAGGKGGVGKSTVAYNLAAELDAVVVDGDLGMADLPTGPGPDLHDVLGGRATVVEAVRDGRSVPLLPCGRSLAGARASDPTALERALERVRREYGRVVVDCPAGLRADVGIPLLVADACVLVTVPDDAALADALRTRALARQFDAGLLAVVVNRADETAPTGAVERQFGAPVTRLPESSRLAAVQETGEPLARCAPESPERERFASLASSVRSVLRS